MAAPADSGCALSSTSHLAVDPRAGGPVMRSRRTDGRVNKAKKPGRWAGWLLGGGMTVLLAGCGWWGAPASTPKVTPIPSHDVVVAAYGFRFQVPRSWHAAAPVAGRVRWESRDDEFQVEAWGSRAAVWTAPASLVKHQAALGIPPRSQMEAFAQGRVGGWTRIEESWSRKGEDYLLIAFVNGHAANFVLFRYQAKEVATGIQVVAKAAATFHPHP